MGSGKSAAIGWTCKHCHDIHATTGRVGSPCRGLLFETGYGLPERPSLCLRGRLSGVEASDVPFSAYCPRHPCPCLGIAFTECDERADCAPSSEFHVHPNALSDRHAVATTHPDGDAQPDRDTYL